MSSSFFGFFAHAGFVQALSKSGIKPIAYSGTSAGALIAAMAASGIPPEKMFKILSKLKKKHFWDPDYISLFFKSLKLFKGWPGLLKGNAFRKILEENLPGL